MKINSIDNNINENTNFNRTLFYDLNGKIKTFALMSIENPLGIKDLNNEEQNKIYIKFLNNNGIWEKKYPTLDYEKMLDSRSKTGEDCLRYGHFNYVPLKKYYEKIENSLIIFNIGKKDAECIASSFGQISFFWGEISHNDNPSTISYYQTYNYCVTYKLVEISNNIVTDEDANKFYTKYGFNFQIKMHELENDVLEPINKDRFEESFNEDNPFSHRARCRRDAFRKSE